MTHESHRMRSTERKIHTATAAAGESLGRSAIEAGKRGWEGLSETASAQAKRLKRQGEAVQQTVEGHAVASTLIGFGLGVIVGGLWFRR
jgi:hypothetical protein